MTASCLWVTLELFYMWLVVLSWNFPETIPTSIHPRPLLPWPKNSSAGICRQPLCPMKPVLPQAGLHSLTFLPSYWAPNMSLKWPELQRQNRDDPSSLQSLQCVQPQRLTTFRVSHYPRSNCLQPLVTRLGLVPWHRSLLCDLALIMWPSSTKRSLKSPAVYLIHLGTFSPDTGLGNNQWKRNWQVISSWIFNSNAGWWLTHRLSHLFLPSITFLFLFAFPHLLLAPRGHSTSFCFACSICI